MRRVDSDPELRAGFEAASREALSAFGEGSLYVEKYIEHPHHVEIQVFGDGQGGAVHLGERECSIQRRHQKVLEESPSPILNRYPKTREQMTAAALQISRHIRYAGAGTFEFIVDGQGRFYFLEMNTRLQVEHPVTEWVTGVDLVAWQLLLAAGEFRLPEHSPECRGAALEVRIYAEDSHSFLPAPGALGRIQLPSGPFVRSDAAFIEPSEVSLHYDPMIAKVSVWAPTRPEALARLQVALDETRINPPKRSNLSVVGSLKTNLSFLKRLVRNPDVKTGETTTDLIPKFPDLTAMPSSEPSLMAALAVSLHPFLQGSLESAALGGGAGEQRVHGYFPGSGSSWTRAARAEAIQGKGSGGAR
jgi:acetyl-CoA carboxylase biotin carboxylase subunit